MTYTIRYDREFNVDSEAEYSVLLYVTVTYCIRRLYTAVFDAESICVWRHELLNLSEDHLQISVFTVK